MKPAYPQRRTTRLQEYDYTQPGAYFVTITAAERAARFGAIIKGEMHQNAFGDLLQREWQRLPQRFPGLSVDTFVVMPDHIHGILVIEDTPLPQVGAQQCKPEPVPGITTLRPLPESFTPPGPTVGAQQCKPVHPSSTPALRPSLEPLTPIDRAQHPQRGSSPDTAPLRPYEKTGGSQKEPPHVLAGSVGAIVRAFKSATTLRYHHMKSAEPGPLWQRNYYEHIIRSQAEMENVHAYIQNNPAQWEKSM